MTRSSNDRLHILLGAEELQVLDSYRFAAKLPTRSDAARELMRLAVLWKDAGASPPKEHSDALRLMAKIDEVVREDSAQKKALSLVSSKAAKSGSSASKGG